MRSIPDDGNTFLVKKRKKRKRKSRVLPVRMDVVSNLELILPQDLKMWAKSAGRKFLQAQDKIKALSTKDVSASAYWDEHNNIVVVSNDNTIRETYS
tara:strand:+ start:152 stop:442 length:291 start_codon:yes stop_codon:yes gene_type:complete